MPATTRTLATAVFVTDPKTHETLLLAAGTTVADPTVAEQITHPDAWEPEQVRSADPQSAHPQCREVRDGRVRAALMLSDAEYAYLRSELGDIDRGDLMSATSALAQSRR